MQKYSGELSDFDYDLPEALIAQAPLAQRDGSRLLVLNRSTGAIQHSYFKKLVSDFLLPSDLLIFNQSKVVHARLLGERASGGKVEIFLLRQISADSTKGITDSAKKMVDSAHRGTINGSSMIDGSPVGIFECLLRVTTANKIGLEFQLGSSMAGKITGPGTTPTTFHVELRSLSGNSLESEIEKIGHVPLPPYIERADAEADRERYQTVYAKMRGSVAAPTAGLHFTEDTFAQLRQKGIEYDFVTLHVGLGTFQPIKVENLSEHKMHQEEFYLEPALWEKIQERKRIGGRIIAVGTTTVRSLESYARGKRGQTDLFLYPGEKFHIVDGMITNFHQPKSSLLVMLSAFAGRDNLLAAYRAAIQEQYRFFSYGDCMLVV